MLSSLIEALVSKVSTEVRKATAAAIAAGMSDGINDATEALSLQDFEAELPEPAVLLLDPPAIPTRKKGR